MQEQFTTEEKQAIQKEIAQKYADKVFGKLDQNVDLANSEKYTLDSAAEFYNLPISRMYEVSKEQFQKYLESEEFERHLHFKFRMAIDAFNSQGRRRKKGEDRILWYFSKRFLESAKKEYKIPRRAKIALIDLVIFFYESDVFVHLGWESGTCKDEFGIERHLVGRKESRELYEKVQNFKF